MIIMKFGGTSVGSAEMIKRTIEIIIANLNKKPVVVVSAVGGVTDMILEEVNKAIEGKKEGTKIRTKHLELLRELGLNDKLVEAELNELYELFRGITLIKEITPRTMDYAVSFGERMSAKIVAEYAKKKGVKAKAYNAYDVGFVTDSGFTNAKVLAETGNNLRASFRKFGKSEVPIITGFIAKDKEGNITTIGRGGSDYTAAIIGAVMRVKEIQIWSDVDGIMTADPRIIKEAEKIDEISFEAAAELAYFGAKVLHPKTIQPAMMKNIPVRSLNTYNPAGIGTSIVKKTAKPKKTITAIACKKKLSLININSPKMLFAPGFMYKIFKVFARHSVSVDTVSTSEVNVSLTTDSKKNVNEVVKELKKIANVKLDENKATVCVVGPGLRNMPGVLGTIFSALGEAKINVEMVSQGASEINVTLVVDGTQADAAMKVLHKAFFTGGGKNEKN
ncbi:MAG: aspartate kinase [bacterium]|nr:aspartate kinase [bacterium]